MPDLCTLFHSLLRLLAGVPQRVLQASKRWSNGAVGLRIVLPFEQSKLKKLESKHFREIRSGRERCMCSYGAGTVIRLRALPRQFCTAATAAAGRTALRRRWGLC